jgi:hypothetical protein
MAHIAVPASRPGLSSYLLASPLLLGMFFGAAGDARAQSLGQGGSTNSQRGPGAADRRGANRAGAARPRNEPSEAYRESIRRTLELRRQRRANRGQVTSGPVGGIVPWPMPPALVIRHTPRVHDEIESFLGLLRK